MPKPTKTNDFATVPELEDWIKHYSEKGERGYFRIIRQSGQEDYVDGLLYGSFGIYHREIYYQVTHTSTGLALGAPFNTRIQAERFIALAGNLCDWRNVERAKKLPLLGCHLYCEERECNVQSILDITRQFVLPKKKALKPKRLKNASKPTFVSVEETNTDDDYDGPVDFGEDPNEEPVAKDKPSTVSTKLQSETAEEADDCLDFGEVI